MEVIIPLASITTLLQFSLVPKSPKNIAEIIILLFFVRFAKLFGVFVELNTCIQKFIRERESPLSRFWEMRGLNVAKFPKNCLKLLIFKRIFEF